MQCETAKGTREWTRRRVSLPVAGVTAVAVLNLVLLLACLSALRQNSGLRLQLTRAVAMITPNQGTLAPPLAGENEAGLERVLSFQRDPRQTVVFTFSASCPYCKAYWTTMHTLQKLTPRAIRLAYIDTHDRPAPGHEFLSSHGIGDAPVLIRLSPESALAYRALLLPQLELLDADGRVQWSHAGKMTPRDQDGLLALIQSNHTNHKGE
jgi:thiol-disulfide isomerase/thioredoxin